MEWTTTLHYTNWENRGCHLPESLKEVDWSGEYYPVSHPVRAISRDGRNLVDYDTGEVIAVIKEGYSWFWGHDHMHVCKENWDGKTYPDGWPSEPLGE